MYMTELKFFLCFAPITAKILFHFAADFSLFSWNSLF